MLLRTTGTCTRQQRGHKMHLAIFTNRKDELSGQQGSQPDFSDFSVKDVNEDRNVESFRKSSAFGGSEKISM